MRIWKFVPRRYRKDAGWENDHLDKQGRYQGPDLRPEVSDLACPFDNEDDN
jgi:hypothetical protein